jgi:hypothetical protein
MAVIIDINQTQEYILKKERDQENPTKFIIGVLDAKTKAMIRDKCTRIKVKGDVDAGDDAWMQFNVNQARVLYARYGVKDASGLVDQNGKSVEFSVDMIRMLKESDIYEIGDAVKNFNEFSEDEAKNS